MSIADKIRLIRKKVKVDGSLSISDDCELNIRRDGKKYDSDAILDSLVDFYEVHGRWPENTTVYRDDPYLPHSATVKRHFGSLGEAERRARERLESG